MSVNTASLNQQHSQQPKALHATNATAYSRSICSM